MNKRQAKKKKRNEFFLGGMTYREVRKNMRIMHEHEVYQRHSKITLDDISLMVELGIYTREEAEARITYIQRKKLRWRQLI